jgi:hypothetical protein
MAYAPLSFRMVPGQSVSVQSLPLKPLAQTHFRRDATQTPCFLLAVQLLGQMLVLQSRSFQAGMHLQKAPSSVVSHVPWPEHWVLAKAVSQVSPLARLSLHSGPVNGAWHWQWTFW